MNFTTFSVRVADAEKKALEYVMVDIQEWLQNTINARANIAMNEVVRKEVERMMADPSTTSIPADKESIVLNCSQPTLKEDEDRRILEFTRDSLVSNPV